MRLQNMSNMLPAVGIVGVLGGRRITLVVKEGFFSYMIKTCAERLRSPTADRQCPGIPVPMRCRPSWWWCRHRRCALIGIGLCSMLLAAIARWRFMILKAGLGVELAWGAIKEFIDTGLSDDAKVERDSRDHARSHARGA
jgi:hypothetical protein